MIGIMKIFSKLFTCFTAMINVISTIATMATIIRGYESSNNLTIYIFVLSMSSVYLYLKWFREYSKHRALRILAHRGKIYTINYMVYLDFLDHKFHDDYDNDPKENNIVVNNSKFTFHFFNYTNEKYVDVDYKHKFGIVKHNNKFDVIILHIGKLIQAITCENKVNYCSTYIIYQNKFYPIVPLPCLFSDMKNYHNQVLDRVICSLPKMNAREEILEFHYRCEKEFKTDEDDVFVIYPKNYARKFLGKALFQLTFDIPYIVDVQLLTLPYDSLLGNPIKSIAQFESKNGGTLYECELPSISTKYIYLISIRQIE